MKKVFICTLMLIAFHLGYSQVSKPLDPDHFLVKGEKVPQVLLVASWHFDYPGLDANVTEEKNRINIYSEKRQRELDELLNYIALFKPTKIMVESGPIVGYLEYNYREYKAGREKLMANERSQIGMKLVERFKLDTLYGVDAWPLILDLEYDSSLKNIPYLAQVLQQHYFGGEDKMQMRYKDFYSHLSKYQVEHTLLESFKYMNSDKVLDRYFGSYISGGQFASKEQIGPDALSMFWFNRNLRIFKNITDVETNPNDRILVLFGAGHAAILRWFFECSPSYHLVQFDSLK